MHKSREPRVSCLNPGKTSRDLLQHVSRPDSPTMAREQCRAPLRHSHGDPTSLAPHERLTDLAVVPREKPHTGAAAREQPRDSAVIEGCGPSSPAWPRDQSRGLSPNASGGLTPLSPPSELQEIPVAIREQSGVLCFHSRGMPVSPGASGMQPRDPCRPWRGLLALQSLESNPQLSFATRMEDWTCLGQHKKQPEFPVVIRESCYTSRKTTWFPRHRKMKPFPATVSGEKADGCNWSSNRDLAP